MRQLSLAKRFLLGSLVILIAGMTGIGLWVTRQIEDGVVHRSASTTAVYVDSLIAGSLQDLADGDALSADSAAQLDWLLTATPLGQQVAVFRVWDRQGRVVYSSIPEPIGGTSRDRRGSDDGVGRSGDGAHRRYRGRSAGFGAAAG